MWTASKAYIDHPSEHSTYAAPCPVLLSEELMTKQLKKCLNYRRLSTASTSDLNLNLNFDLTPGACPLAGSPSNTSWSPQEYSGLPSF